MNIMQTKPLRSYGVDVTYNSLQPVLDSLGIDEQVKNLSQAEKEILRYIATLKQASISMGDFANNLESPSNQMKIFKQQLTETKVALTSLFIGGFSEILPYANAFLMVVKEVSTAIATMFGIELTDYNTGIASQESIYDGIADSADGASKAVKELKKQTFGWDEIHNINENKDSGSSGTSGVSGGIDQRLLDAITGYDNGMDKVKMKATEIRDRIMEWLGFTKHINEETGKVYFSLDNTDSTMYKIADALKRIVKYGKEAIKGVFKVIKNDFDNGIFGKALVTSLNLVSDTLEYISKHKSTQKIIAKILEVLIGYKVVKTIFNPIIGITKKLGTNFSLLSSKISTTTLKLKGIDATTEEGKKSFEQLTSKITKFITGLTLSTVGITTLSVSMTTLCEKGANLSNVLGIVGGSLSSIAGGAIAGSAFGTLGTIIGGSVGAVTALITAISNYKTQAQVATEETLRAIDAHDEYCESFRKQRKELEETMNKELTRIETHEKLKNELLELVDANGMVQESDKKRVQFILTELSDAYGIEYKLIGNQIENWDNLHKSIEEVISAKKAEIIISYKQENYYNALEQENKLYKELKENSELVTRAKKDLEKAESDYKKTTETANIATTAGKVAISKAKDAVVEASSAFDRASETYKNSAINYRDNSIDIQTYEELLVASTDKNYSEMEDIMNRTSETTYNKWAENLYNQTKDIDPKNGKIGSKLVAQWTSLGTTNEQKFMEEISKLDPDLQQRIIDKMEDKGFKMSSNLAKGLKKNNLKVEVETEIKKPKNTTIELDVDTTKAQKKTDSWLKKLINSIPILSIGGKANGGVFYGETWKNIKQYANGGAPSHGSMFVAGEHGAEIVGHINGRTEVLNQSQIASAIYSAVFNAMSQFNSGGIAEINVHASKDVIVETAINGINQQIKQTGNCPIRIPT